MKCTSLILLVSVYFGAAWCPSYCVALALSQGNLNNNNIIGTSSTNNNRIDDNNVVDGRRNIVAANSDCNTDRLAVYKVVLHTYWTRDLFPKHYPDWRPPAQWTKTCGRSHDASFNLFRLGQTSSAGMKMFAETGRSDSLDAQLSMDGSVFDEFILPQITSGGGRSESKFFVDGNHSMISLVTRIVPSPDWFIGVDSFQLCVGGSWIDTVTVELDPLDAGTDNGFTFTAPNWPTEPQGIIYRITSRYPSHPAGSFYYPQNKRLPPIATFQFIKLKEYELSEVFHYAEDDRKYETIETRTHLESEHNHVEMNNELSATIELERQHEMTQKPTVLTEKDRIRAKLIAKLNPSINSTSKYMLVPKNNKEAILNNIAHSYAVSKKHKKRILRPPKDCRVGHWSEWSSCSKVCGIGEMHRYRKVIKHAKRGGRPCPPLQESKWCGSARDCSSPAGYFKW